MSDEKKKEVMHAFVKCFEEMDAEKAVSWNGNPFLNKKDKGHVH